jgi:invasion protein IalB
MRPDAGAAIDKARGVPKTGSVPGNAAIREEVDRFLKSGLLRLAAVLGLVAAVSPIAGSASFAQGVVKAQYGDWQMSCDTPPGASFEQCAIIQNVTAEDQPNVGLSVIVLKTADRQARLLRVLAPLGVLLPNGLGLNIDGTDIGRVAFVRCLPNGCVAEVVLDDELINKLSTGSTAIFVVFKTPEEGIGIPVSLNGFKDGFGQLP